VSHVHVHLIPLNEMDDMRFTKKIKMTSEEFTLLAEAISAKIKS
jgi:histidine triad (HIT) family protein